MPKIALSIVNGLKVGLVFLGLYVFLPYRLTRFRSDDEFLDRVFISLIRMLSLVTLLVHILGLLRIYDSFSALGGLIAAYVLLLRTRGEPLGAWAQRLRLRVIMGILDMIEQPKPFKEATLDYLSSRIKTVVGEIGRAVRILLNPSAGLPSTFALGVAAYVRFRHSIMHVAHGASDTYTHLAWVKYIALNDFYRGGIYPRGYHAIISYTSKITFLDSHEIMRYLGPLGGWLIVLSIYYVAHKITRNPSAASIGAALFGLGRGFPNDIWRQISPLPQEFATVFIMPGFYYISRYCETQDNYYLLLFGQCLYITLMVHPYASLYLVLSAGCTVMAALLARRMKVRMLMMLVITGLASTFLGTCWMLFGRLAGYEWHGSLGYVQSQIVIPAAFDRPTAIDLPALLPGMKEARVALAVSLFLTASALVFGLSPKLRQKIFLPAAGLGLLCIVSWALARPAFGLPALMDLARAETFAGIAMATILPFPLSEPLHCSARFVAGLAPKETQRRLLVRSIAALISIAMILSGRIVAPAGNLYEYDQAVEMYYRIRYQYPPLDWTIVSPTEQYSQVLGYGWHYDLYEFLTKHPVHLASDPSYDPDIPTTYIFIYVEKKVLGSGRSLEPDDALKPLPVAAQDPWTELYASPHNRAILEAKIDLWCQEYARAHKNIDIIYEDSEFKVYRIIHEPKRSQ